MAEIKVVLKWERLNERNDVENLKGESDYGIYQIIGYHPVFGDDSMLYIGLAKEQTFAKRIGQHEGWLAKEYGVKIYLGRTTNIENDIWDDIITDAEALLIYFHSPPYNSKCISEYPTPKNRLRIISIGDYGDLYPEISHEGLELDDVPLRPKDE